MAKLLILPLLINKLSNLKETKTLNGFLILMENHFTPFNTLLML
jgi:hypothetical protein